jgi:Flp pilus assembly protein TadD
MTMGDSRLEGLRMEFNAAADLLAIGERVLTGWTEAAAENMERAVAAMEEATAHEDALLYGEPPEWSIPTRQDLGAVLLFAGRAAEAEEAFRADLEKFPENGWSLQGLAVSLRRQRREAEAASVEAELDRVWETADVEPPMYPAR